jgi:hypothetical protein
MIKITRVQNRPSTDIPMYSPIEEKVIYQYNTFVSFGKLYISHYWSEDRLTKTATWEWDSIESLTSYNSNLLVVENAKQEKLYNQSMNITLEETIEII